MNDKLDFGHLDVEAVARAIEADAGESLPELREGLAELKAGQIGHINTPEEILVRSARRKLGLSQEAFAEVIGTPLATLRGWEQGRFVPPGSAIRLITLLGKRPELVEELGILTA
jgi:putative transcriptional regulator